MPERIPEEQLDQAIEALLAGASPATAGGAELAPLAGIAASLCHLPDQSFKTRLQKELEKRAVMTTVVSPRAGFRTITPFIVHAQAPELVDFIKSTFNAEELKRNPAEKDDAFYSEVRIGDSILMIAGGSAARYGNVVSALHVYVDDCDAAWRRALHAGAVTLGETGEPADRPYGERSASVRDAFGNHWYIATRLGSGPAPEGVGTVLPIACPEDARQYIQFLKSAFGAEQLAFVEQSGRVMYATVRVGDAVLEIGEPLDREGLPANGSFLFVEDVDAAFARALAAGATAIRPPSDVPSSGLRFGVVRDPAGCFWWPARWLS